MIPKFKVWDNDIQRMYEQDDLVIWFDKNGVGIVVDDYRGELLTDFELLQSTGLKDINGKEIFEGDIVRNNYGEHGHIKWLKGGFVFHEDGANFYLFSIGAGQPFEIVGNIYEHPELLEED